MSETAFQPEALADRLKTAREAEGLSIRDVAKQLQLTGTNCVSHVTLSKYERAVSAPTLDTISALANIYRRPLGWFLESGPKLKCIRYRNLKSKVRQSDRLWFEANAQRWLEAYDRLERRLKKTLSAEISIPPVTAKTTPVEMAKAVRKALGIKEDAPIPSVVECIERTGIRVIELPTEMRIDGIAGMFGDSLVIVLNSATGNDRARMNASHEWGHAALGHCSESGDETVSKSQEAQAYEFASHFILPESRLHEAFVGESMVRLVKFKEEFGISLAAMIHRAERADILSSTTARHLWIEFAKRGWRMKEPGFVRADRATRFEQLLESAITTGAITWREAEIVTGASVSDLKDRVRLAMGMEVGVHDDGTDQNILKYGSGDEISVTNGQGRN